ncbi:folic acid synthesis protein Fol1p [Trichomonascus vanleenenianus]|uniref:trifunctional dihydropteroate synthetase/dihydrohydroxymethylpterin pyrophosphokinase/dihydroneopterin aldolase FOL1 n=1 Tax=Trichomonascus vanleenenianus TaxID=2268995 RepID=UPI003ECACED8
MMMKGIHSFSGEDTRTAMDTHNSEKQDLVFVRELFVKALTGVDAWHRPRPQPLSISIWLQTSVARAGTTDHLMYSLNYDVISRKVTRTVESGKFRSLEDVAEHVADAVLKDAAPNQWCKVHVKKPRALLRAGAAEIIIARQKQKAEKNAVSGKDYVIVKPEGTVDSVIIQKLQLVTIIGVNTIERMHKQNIVIDLILHKPPNDVEEGPFNRTYDFRACVDAVSNHVENSTYKTVEAFVTSVAEVVAQLGVWKVTVRAEKPSAITFADAAGVEITRTRDFFEENKNVYSEPMSPGIATPTQAVSGTSTPLFPQSGMELSGGVHTVYIAFGSNMGDSVANVRRALDELNSRNIKILATSSLYESEPMYVTDQDRFLNGVVKAETTLDPLALLDELKDIESNTLKRVKVVEKGPRSIDLDILLYDDLVMNHPRLNIPHIGMLSRTFVLKPLTDIVPSSQVHPLTAESYHQHLEELLAQGTDPTIQASSALRTLIPLPEGRRLALDPCTRTVPTQIMAIINVTPDSFSDAGKVNLDNVVETAEQFVAQGATILDVGGASSNPKSVDPGSDVEMQRVIPAIKALRASPKLAKIPISVDTYQSGVAEAAIKAGADIINDISAGRLDDKMFEVAARLKVPIILNHTRGTPQEMNSLAHYRVMDGEKAVADDSEEAVLEVVTQELEERVNAATEAGIPRWAIILDPGLGFAKNKSHNLTIIRRYHEFLCKREAFSGLTNLVGPSRKRFIGTITGKKEPSERVLGTAVAVTSLIAGGADIVRVHDVKEMVEVVKMADAIYRNVPEDN